MPIYHRPDKKPVIEFVPSLEISPFVLYRRLRDMQTLLLIDVRREPSEMTLVGAVQLPDGDWKPPAGMSSCSMRKAPKLFSMFNAYNKQATSGSGRYSAACSSMPLRSIPTLSKAIPF